MSYAQDADADLVADCITDRSSTGVDVRRCQTLTEYGREKEEGGILLLGRKLGGL
jgi:hypothetical protein